MHYILIIAVLIISCSSPVTPDIEWAFLPDTGYSVSVDYNFSHGTWPDTLGAVYYTYWTSMYNGADTIRNDTCLIIVEYGIQYNDKAYDSVSIDTIYKR